MTVTHIAGPPVQVGAHLRQRCSWCGAALIDYALDRIGVLEGDDPTPATWPAGELVEVDGGLSHVVQHTDGDPLPANACAQLDPEVTV